MLAVMDSGRDRFGRRVRAGRGSHGHRADGAIAIRNFVTSAVFWPHYRKVHELLMSREPELSVGRSRQRKWR